MASLLFQVFTHFPPSLISISHGITWGYQDPIKCHLSSVKPFLVTPATDLVSLLCPLHGLFLPFMAGLCLRLYLCAGDSPSLRPVTESRHGLACGWLPVSLHLDTWMVLQSGPSSQPGTRCFTESPCISLGSPVFHLAPVCVRRGRGFLQRAAGVRTARRLQLLVPRKNVPEWGERDAELGGLSVPVLCICLDKVVGLHCKEQCLFKDL